MTHREERVRFTQLVAELIVAINGRTWDYGEVEVAVDEWTVHSKRLYMDVETNERRIGIDRVHHPKGFHPKGLAVDLLVYIGGIYITDGSHSIWGDLDSMAKALDARLNFGNEFNDSNHLSFGELK